MPDPQIEQLIRDHRDALLADARYHRQVTRRRRGRPARRWAGRRRRAAVSLAMARLTAVAPAPDAARRSNVAEVLAQLAAAVEPLLSGAGDARTDRVAADLLVKVTSALEGPAQAAGLEPLTRGTPTIVSLRWLARLAERTTAHPVGLAPAGIEELRGIVADLRSLDPDRSAGAHLTVRARRIRARALRLPIGLLGVR